jgi:23S rRNA (cytosine1962-C5)-methyltransferase
VTQVILKPGHVQPVWAGHPWIFAQGIEKLRGKADNGAEVEVHDARGNVLGRGLYSAHSAIAVRLYTRDGTRTFDESLVEERLRTALARRQRFGLPSTQTSGFRALHGEGDELPGLIVDVYGDAVVLQLGTIGMHQRRAAIVTALQRVLSPRTIIDRTTEGAGKIERFEPTPGLVTGEPIDAFRFTERGLRFAVPIGLAQKTGFYFDQRPLRQRIEELSTGRRVLDAYSYVGTLGLAAARGGASEVLCVDSSEPALEVGRQLAQDNALKLDFRRDDAVDALFGFDKEWDLVISDPPKLATSRAGRERAQKALRRIARATVQAARPLGLVSLSSCSAALGTSELERALALGARDLGRSATVLERIFQGPDHPVPAAFPEGLYLSTLIAEVT